MIIIRYIFFERIIDNNQSSSSFQTVLHILVTHAYKYVWIRLMLMRSCDPCAQDADGYTAAHYAVERDDVETLKSLTTRFHSQVKPIPETQILTIHEQCLRALSLRENQGLLEIS